MVESAAIGRIVRHPIGDTESRESTALLAGGSAFVLGAVIALFVFWGRDVPISGRGSLGDFVAIGGAVIAVGAFLGGGLLRRAQDRAAPTAAPERPRLRWFDVAALAVAHAVIALLGWAAIAALLSDSFVGALVYPTSAAILGGVGWALTAYLAYLSAVNLTPMLLSLVLAVFLTVGAFASMLSATDPLWWQKNLSTLGISDDLSALAFNLTLIVAGVLVTTIAHYAAASLPDSSPGEIRSRRLVRLWLALIGVLLACVGLLPVDEFFELHGIAASGMVVVYVALVLALRRLVPSMPRIFLLLGYVYVAVIVVLAVFFITGYYTLTAVELVAAVLVFSWLIVFLRNAGTAQAPGEESAPPRPRSTVASSR
jgi:hypothetical membrane protein